MIKAVIFDLDNTLLDFKKMKEYGVQAAISAMIEAGLDCYEDEAIMIGDWPERDMVGAKKVGIKSIFARYGDTSDIKNSGADWEVDNIYEVVRIVDELNGV